LIEGYKRRKISQKNPNPSYISTGILPIFAIAPMQQSSFVLHFSHQKINTLACRVVVRIELFNRICCTPSQKLRRYSLCSHLRFERRLVEAAGIEPASENRITGTSTCLVDKFNLVDRTARRQTFQFTNSLNFASVREWLPRLSRQIDALSPVNGHIRVKRAAFLGSHGIRIIVCSYIIIRPFYVAWSEPRHAIRATPVPVETRSPPFISIISSDLRILSSKWS